MDTEITYSLQTWQALLAAHNRSKKRADVLMFDSVSYYIFNTLTERSILFESLDDLHLYLTRGTVVEE